MFKELFNEGQTQINSGSQKYIDGIMDKAQAWEEDNNYACQEYYSYTKDYKKYFITSDDINKVKKYDVYKILQGK